MMLQMIRSLQAERLFLSMQPLLLGSFVKWSLLFSITFLLLSIYRKLASDIRHVILLLLVYAVVLIPLANAIFPLEWFGDTTITRQGNKIVKAVNAAIMPQYFEAPIPDVAVTPVGATQKFFTMTHTRTGVSWTVLLFMLWGLGAIILSIGLIIGRIRAGIFCRRFSDQPPEKEKAELAELINKLNIRWKVRLVVSRVCRVPFTFRVFHPLVVLPLKSVSWPEERVRAVLLHELSHIRRGDYITKLFARIVCSIFWFLPFLWFAFSRLSLEQETACDLSVLRSGIRPTAYARHILDIASLSVRNVSFQGSFLAEGRKNTLERRIIHALQFERGRIINIGGIKTTRLVLLCTLIIAAIAVIGSCAASRKTITEKDFIAAWSGTWINEDLAGSHLNPQILFNHPDGTMEFFINAVYMESGKKDMRIRNYGIPLISDKWVDREGRIWYTAVTKPVKSGTMLSYYGFINESGKVLEIHEAMCNKAMNEWDTDEYYLHRVYYRQ